MQLKATAHSEAGRAALSVYTNVLREVRGDVLVHRALQRVGDQLFVHGRLIDLALYRRVMVCGVGKASVAMARAVIAVLGGAVDGGLVVTKHEHGGDAGGLRVIEAGHPVPDEHSLRAGEELLRIAQSSRDHDLVIFVLSGGASALTEAPVAGVSLDDIQAANRFLLASGLDIGEVNEVRSRLSRIKAGGLAEAFSRATVVCLVLSDVIGNRLEVIGSGPFVSPKPGSKAVARFAHSSALPDSVRAALSRPTDLSLSPPNPVEHFIVGSASLAVHAALEQAKRLGLEAHGYADPLSGEAREMARKIMKLGERRSALAEGPFCLVLGGETTVMLAKGAGKGGRCQEMAVAASNAIAKMPGSAFLAAGTDGTDGPTDAAGGIIEPDSAARADMAGWPASRALRTHDSYEFLSACNGLIFTGPTDSNVNDIALYVSAM
jgi:glycerate-2-kinase